MLTLPIKKKWFDMIKSGEKKEEVIIPKEEEVKEETVKVEPMEESKGEGNWNYG